MIKIVLLFFVFLLYVSFQREGLRNYLPISKGDKVYGVNVIKGSPEHIYNKLTDEKDPLYEGGKYKAYPRSDILLDMQYFNNASYLIFQLNT
jgi:hypothetical protein